MITYTIEILDYIFERVKRVKKPIVKLYPDGRVIGTDEQFASLNTVVNSSILSDQTLQIPCPIILDTKEITAFMREVSKNYEFYNPSFNVPYEFTTNCKSDNLTLQNHIELNYRLDELYNNLLCEISSKPIIYSEENFQTSIPEMFSLKTTDGAKMYSFGVDKKFLMSSFNAIHPATKTDRVDLIIRDSDIYSYIAEFVIYKKKDNYELHEFLRFRKL